MQSGPAVSANWMGERWKLIVGHSRSQISGAEAGSIEGECEGEEVWAVRGEHHVYDRGETPFLDIHCYSDAIA